MACLGRAHRRGHGGAAGACGRASWHNQAQDDKTMPDTPNALQLQNWAQVFKDLADKLDRAATVERKPEHLATHASRLAAQAMRTLLAVADAGALQIPFRDPSAAVVEVKNAAGERLPLTGRPLPLDTNDESHLLLAWKLFACPWLRHKRPDAFPPDAGVRDFPPVKVDAQGRILGPDGQPIRRVFVTQDGTEVPVPENMTGEELAAEMLTGRYRAIATTEAVRVFRGQPLESFDGDDQLSFLRATADDWSAACAALARLLEDEVQRRHMQDRLGTQPALAARASDRGADETQDQAKSDTGVPRPPGDRGAVSADTATAARSAPTAANVGGSVDFGILTVREDEYTAVLDHFPDRQTVRGQGFYEVARVPAADGREVTVAISRCIEPGHGAAHEAARALIDDLDPAWILLVGIAGGLPDDGYSLGDVLLASRIYDLSVSAEIEDNDEHRREWSPTGGPVHPEVEAVLAAIPGWKKKLGKWNTQGAVRMKKPSCDVPPDVSSDRYYGPPEYRAKVRASLSRHFPSGKRPRPPCYAALPVASGNILTKDASLAAEWKALARTVGFVEMEAGGVYRAARRHQREYPVLVIRGLSDIVGFKRSAEWTEYACRSGAAFTAAFVRLGVVQPPGQGPTGPSVVFRGFVREHFNFGPLSKMRFQVTGGDPGECRCGLSAEGYTTFAKWDECANPVRHDRPEGFDAALVPATQRQRLYPGHTYSVPILIQDKGECLVFDGWWFGRATGYYRGRPLSPDSVVSVTLQGGGLSWHRDFTVREIVAAE